MEQRQKDGRTLEHHLLLAQQRQRRDLPELEVPELPAEVEYVWLYYQSIAVDRGYGPTGQPEPLTSEVLNNWSRLRRLELTGMELDIITQLDRLFVSKQYERKDEDD